MKRFTIFLKIELYLHFSTYIFNVIVCCCLLSMQGECVLGKVLTILMVWYASILCK